MEQEGKMTRFVTVLAGLLALGLILVSGPAQATLSYDLGTVISGTTPDGPSPWLELDFTTNATGVQVKFTNNMGAGQFVTEWDFNTSLSLPLTFSFVSGTEAASITQGSNCCKADGDGYFDIEFNFPTSSALRFTTGVTIYNILCVGCSETDFDFLSVSVPPSAVGTGNYHTAAHIQGIPVNDCSGWIADGSGGGVTGNDLCARRVPEPSSLALLGFGLVGLAVGGRRWMTKK